MPLPAGYPEDRTRREAILDAKPRHWRLWYDGTLVSNYEAPADWAPATLTPDQVREVNARNAVECELIDEALGRVLDRIAGRGWADDLDVVFTTDHGELQGDFGLLFKGPYHVDALMRLPLVWRPAPRGRRRPGRGDPTGGAGRPGPHLLRHRRHRGRRPGCRAAPSRSTTPTLTPAASNGCCTEWDSEIFGTDVHLRTIMRDHWVCSAYRPGTSHDGTEGELYDLATTRSSRPTGGTTRPWPGARRPRWPTSGTTSPRPGNPGSPSRPRSDPHRPAPYRAVVRRGELRSKMIRRPWRVSHGSTYSISSE